MSIQYWVLLQYMLRSTIRAVDCAKEMPLDRLPFKKVYTLHGVLVFFTTTLGLPCIAREARVDRCREAYLMSAHGVKYHIRLLRDARQMDRVRA